MRRAWRTFTEGKEKMMSETLMEVKHLKKYFNKIYRSFLILVKPILKSFVSVKSSALKFNPIHAKLEKTQKTN